ncbi:hypothetical protein GGR55DRAFT_633386, partial [Xylaria sp. FL0064]
MLTLGIAWQVRWLCSLCLLLVLYVDMFVVFRCTSMRYAISACGWIPTNQVAEAVKRRYGDLLECVHTITIGFVEKIPL